MLRTRRSKRAPALALGAAVVLLVAALFASGTAPGSTAITDWPFRALLAASALAALAAVALAGPHRGLHSSAVLLTALLVLGSAGAAVNAHYDYYRTLGAVVGLEPDDEEPLAALLRQTRVPRRGVVATVTVPATRSGFVARPALVYVPPAWFARPRPALPVVVLLHGTPGAPQDWIDGGRAQETADRWAAAHRGVAPVLVMPDVNGTLTADTECVDSPLGRVETYLTADVTGFVQQTLRTRPPGPAWAVAGLSEGGSCALMLALRHPGTFGSFGDYSGLAGPRVGETNADTGPTVTALFGGSPQTFAAHEPADLLASRRYPQLGGWFEVGDADPEPSAAQQALVPLAQRAGIATCARVVPGGGHTFDVFSAAFADSLPWLVARTDPTRGHRATC